MTKTLLFSIGLIAPAALMAQTRTTIANGNATNPFTWDCTCVPMPGNTIIINHNVTLDSDFGYASGSVTINASGSLVGDVPGRIFGLSGGSFTNHGTLTVGNAYASGGTFTNNGTITITNGFAVGGSAHISTSTTLNVNDSLLIDVSAMVSNTGAITAPYTLCAGTMANSGSFTGTDFWNSGTMTNAAGPGYHLSNLYTSGTVNSNSMINVSNDLWNSENITNNNQIVIGHDLMNGDTTSGTATLTNNGTISVAHDLNNSETLDGSGSYCIANASNNVGAVNGTLHICDQTGNDFDTNFGTIAGTVTFCSTPDCILGVTNIDQENLNKLYPNPVAHTLNIELNNSASYSLVLVNSMGQQAGQYSFNGNRFSIDLSGYSNGLYVYRISGNGSVLSGTLIKE